jgi:hypothetical protein
MPILNINDDNDDGGAVNHRPQWIKQLQKKKTPKEWLHGRKKNCLE